MSRSTIIANLSARIDAVSGCKPAKATFTATEIPEHGTNGWFILWPDSETLGDEPGTLTQDTLAFRCELLWRIGDPPATAIGAAMDKAHAIRAKLRDGTLEAVDAGADVSINVGTITYERAPSARHIVVSIPFSLDVYTSV
mgnify:CR=1 FL=1